MTEPAKTEAGSESKSPPGNSFADRLFRLDQGWTRLEALLAAAVLILEIIALTLWIALKGLSAEYAPGDGDKNVSGLVFRGLIGAVVLGLAAYKLTNPKAKEGEPQYGAQLKRQNVVVTAFVFLGFLSARLWVNGGVGYFSNFLNWLQNASLLMLIGGLRGVATRLTLWLALLGASLATGIGKHINIDVVMRFLSPKLRVGAAILGWVAAAVMCIAGAWGFFDHIAVALFHVHPYTECADESSGAGAQRSSETAKQCPTPAGEKVAAVLSTMGSDGFIVGRQISLDLKSAPRVLFGTKYNGYFTGADWNAWVKDADWTARFPADQVQGLYAMPEREKEFHIPAVSIPGGQEVRGLLIKEADLIFPFGLLMIALRFLLRVVLAGLGKISVDPDSAHGEDREVEPDPESIRAAAAAVPAKVGE